MIVAMAHNRVIGINNTLPWHLPADLKFFKATTLGKPMIMGRKTFESIGKPLPGRTTIVVTRSADWSVEGVLVEATIEGAISTAKNIAKRDQVDEVMVVGGATIYQALIDQVDTLYVTHVDLELKGDAFFPEINHHQWQETHSQEHPAIDNKPAYRFSTLTKK